MVEEIALPNRETFNETIDHLRQLSGDKALEKRALGFAHNPLVTAPVRQLIMELWNAYSDARWVNELLWEERDEHRKLQSDQKGSHGTE